MARLRGCAVGAWMTCAALVLGGAAAAPVESNAPEPTIRLAFSGATIDDVLDAMNRMSGLPVVREAEVPAGTIDFMSPENYDLESALRDLNIVLQARGVSIRLAGGMLHFEKLADMQREDLPTYVGELPGTLTGDTLVTVVRPLESAMAGPLADQLKGMVAEYGAVIPLVGQNAIVITETASNVRRLLGMLDALDRQDPDGLIEVFPVRNVAASSLIDPLTQLMTIKVEKYMPGKKGKLQKVEETTLEGLTFAADDHAGLIIAKGAQTMLTKLGEIIRMLDVPGGTGGARTVRMVPLALMSAADAVARLKPVIDALPEDRRPQVVPVPEQSSIIVTGPGGEVDEVLAVLAAVEGGAHAGSQGDTMAMRHLPLASAKPDSVKQALTSVLTARHRAAVRLAVAPDGRSLLLAGPQADVAAVAAMAEALDTGGADVPSIRALSISPGTLGEVMQQYAAIKEQRSLPSDVSISVDAPSGHVTLVGDHVAVAETAALIESIAGTVDEHVETRRFTLSHVTPSRVASAVRSAATGLLSPGHGIAWTPPAIEPIDPLEVLLITGRPDDMPAIETIVAAVDRPSPGDLVVRVTPLRGADLSTLNDVDSAFVEMGGGGFGPMRPRVELDASGDRVVVSGHPVSVSLYEQALRRVLDVAGPPRSTRIVQLSIADPSEVSAVIASLAEQGGSLLRDGSQPPQIEVSTPLGGLLVTGTDRQHQAVAGIIRSLDVADPSDAPPLHILEVKVADAAALARTLTAQYAARPAQDRARRPVRITADHPTGTLLVSAHADLFPEIEAIVEELNTVERRDVDGREIRIFRLQVARAESLAATLEQMFPQPLAPVDRRGRPLNHLRPPREVTVRADRGTNSIIVESPLHRMASLEELVASLDVAQREPGQIRTYQVDRRRLSTLSNMLRQLDAQGMLVDEPDTRLAELTVATEPLSGTLVVSGPPAAFTRIEELIQEFDASTPTMPRADMRIIPIDHGDARGLQGVVRSMLLDRTRWPEELRSAAEAGVAVPQPTVSHDGVANRLIISAPESLMPIAAELVAQLDQPRIGQGEADVHVIPLQGMNAREVASAAQVALSARRAFNPGRPQATVQAAPSGRSVIVTGTHDQIVEVVSIIESVDTGDSPDDVQVRTVFLTQARAEHVAPMMESLLGQTVLSESERAHRLRYRLPLPDDREGVRVAADERLNAIIVSGRGADLAAAADMARQLDAVADAKASDASRSVRVLPVRNADPAELAQSIEAVFGGTDGGRAPIVRVDQSSGTLLIRGSASQMDAIDEVVRTIDAAAIAGSRRMQMVPIDPASGDAADIAQTLRRLLQRQQGPTIEIIDLQDLLGEVPEVSRAVWPMSPRMLLVAAAMGAPSSSGVSVAVDPQTNSLVLVGSDRAVSRVRRLLDEVLSQVPQAPGRLRRIELGDRADAGRLARLLTQSMAQVTPPAGRRGDLVRRVSVIADADTNALLVTATDADFETVAGLIRAVAAPADDRPAIVKVYPLVSGGADRAARHLQQLLLGTSRSLQAGRLRKLAVTLMGGEDEVQATFRPDRIHVSSDPRSGSLVVMAPPEAIGFIDRYVELMDQSPVSTSTTLQIFPLHHAEARSLSSTLRNVLRARYSALSRTGVTQLLPDVTHDARTNALLVTADGPQLKEVAGLIAQLDAPITEALPPLRTIAMKSARPSQAARLLQQAIIKGLGARASTTTILPDDASGLLLVRADDETSKEIDRVLAEIDRDAADEFAVRTISLKRADAASVAKALQRLYDDRARVAGGHGRKVTIEGDAAQRMLLVAASDEDYADLKVLVDRIDTPDAGAKFAIQVFPLAHASASDIIERVNSMVWELNYGGAWMMDRRSRKAPQGKTSIFADDRLNALVVTGYGDTFDAVEQVVAVLDQPPSQTMKRTLRVHRLRGVSNSLAQQIVNDMYPSRRSFWMPVSEHDMRVRFDSRRGLVVVYGTEEEQGEVADLLVTLANTGDHGSQIRTFALDNARAIEAVETLTAALGLDPRGQVEGHLMAAPDGGDAVSVTASITADARANAIIVTAPEASMAVVASLVEEIDSLSPPGEQGVFVIELANVPPEEAARVVEAMRLDEPPKDAAAARVLSEPLTITPLEGRNAVMVLASPGDRDTITSIFKSIDAAPVHGEGRVKIVDLKNASASAVTAVLREILNPADQQSGSALAAAVQEQVRRLQMLGKGAGGRDLSLDLTKPIRLVPHESRNAIVMTSTVDNVMALTSIVSLLDELPLTDAVTVRILPLNNMAAGDFSRIVQDLFSQGKRLGSVPGAGLSGIPAGIIGRALLGDVAMTTDERTNTVVVAGTDDAVATVEVLVERLDSQVAGGWIETRLVSLEWAEAAEVSQLLHRVLVEGAQDFPGARAMQKQAGRLRMIGSGGARVVESDVFRPMHELVMVPHDTLNALIVVAEQDNLELVLELVAMLDIEEASPGNHVRFYPLDHASAAQVSVTVQRLFDRQVSSGLLEREDRVSVQADERTNTLIVATSNRSLLMIEQMLPSLDSELAPDFQEIRTLPLEHATAARMASVVQRMMDARLDRLRHVEPETADLQRVTVMTDERTNALIVAAGQDTFEVVQRLVSDLDGSDLVHRGLVEVIDADRSNAGRVADTVRAVMERRYADLPSNVRRTQMPLILVDSRSNSLLVSAGPDDLSDIRDLIVKLGDAPSDPAIGLHLLPVSGTAQAERLAPQLQRLMRERQQSLGEASTPTDRVSVQYDGGTNSLIVASSRENLEVIQGLLDVLERAEAERGNGRTLEVFHLHATTASSMVDMLNDLYVREANRLRGSGAVRVTADDRLNAVLVSASGSDVTEIGSLIGRLDGTTPSSVVEIRQIPLSSANALETVRLIEDVLSGRGLGRRRGTDRATVMRYVRAAEAEMGGSQMQVSTALRESINLTPDIRTNTIIIKAPSDSMDLLVDMIRDLDASSTGSKNVRIFKLENADAEAMASLLRDLFKLDEGDDLLVLKPREAADLADVSEAHFSGTELTAVPDPRQQLAITVDSRTNSLIVSGTPAYLDLVESVIEELDALEANERETFLYQLRNSTASDVAEVLGDFVETEQRKLIETIGVQQLGSAARLLEREITIRGDDKSNSVLVSASPRYMDRIKGVIQELDVDPPQVLIQVLLAEVTLDGGVDWGVDMNKTGGSFSFDMSLAAFPAGVAGGLPSMTLGISDFNVVLRALENQGRLHILSNPSIMAANNEAANINVGEVIYVPVGAQTFETGLTSVPLEEKEVGVILSVTPSINPDGYVRMEVQPTLSKVSAEKDQPAVGVETPRIIQRTADTTVTVRDGQTIVIGGLINESYDYHEDQIPLLGDIPILGQLFRSEREELVRTELVIVLTPHVVKSPADADRIRSLTDGQIDRVTLPSELLDRVKSGEIQGMGLFEKDGYKLQMRELEDEIAPEAVDAP